MTVTRIGIVGAFVAAVLAAPVAEAAEVRLERLYFDCSRMYCPPDSPAYGELLVVRGDRGEANRLTVARGAAGEFRVTDAGGALRVGPGCTLDGERSVVCPTSTPRLWAFVFAGDRGDTVTSSVAVDGVDGGSGNDRLAGSSFADALYGGEGRDVLRGNGGDDALHDGRPTGAIPPDQYEGRFFPPWFGPPAPVAADRDLFDGGAGTDTLGYEGRRRGVIADLARTDRHAGTPGERDALRGLEAAVGGSGADRLFGDGAANALSGGDGDDLLVGRAGDDQLQLDAGSNRVRGGIGDDAIVILGPDRHLERQRVACGLGRDRVDNLFPNDFAEDDCEVVVIGEIHELQPLLPPVSLARPPLASYTTHPVDCEAQSCRLRLEVRLARSPSRRQPTLRGLLLGRTEATIPFRTVTTVSVHLTDRGSRLLRRYRALLIRIQLSTRLDDPRIAAGGAYLTRLRAPS
jgi:RTX calcium-binding nonapeptide repeat (4 copies)